MTLVASRMFPTGSLIQAKSPRLGILFSKAARRQRPVRRQRPEQAQSRVQGRAEARTHGWRPMRLHNRPMDPSVSRRRCIRRTLFRAARCRMPMTAGAFPLPMRPLSSWHGTSRMPCRPFFHPEGPRQWPRTRSSRTSASTGRPGCSSARSAAGDRGNRCASPAPGSGCAGRAQPLDRGIRTNRCYG